MPTQPRMYLPDVPSHIIQRGNNRSACFYTDADYRFYLQCLKDAAGRQQVAVHAYVLMTNHVHLLMTPTATTGISRVMQSVGRRYVQYFNQTWRRTGTLWEDRHKASLVQAEEYLLACYRYIEMNPVRAGMVAHPGDYPWSSYRCNALGKADPVVCSHPVYRQISRDKQRRLYSYRELFAVDLSGRQLHAIRNSANFSMPLGNDRFKAEIESALARKVGFARRGRPGDKCDPF